MPVVVPSDGLLHLLYCVGHVDGSVCWGVLYESKNKINAYMFAILVLGLGDELDSLELSYVL